MWRSMLAIVVSAHSGRDGSVNRCIRVRMSFSMRKGARQGIKAKWESAICQDERSSHFFNRPTERHIAPLGALSSIRN